MSSLPFEPVTVGEHIIHWAVWSGRAVGVQKYTKTHDSSYSGGSSTETIIEMSLQQKNGGEKSITLCSWSSAIRVRDGQRVSAVCGYTGSKNAHWLIFVNHDAREWYWVSYRQIFFKSLGLFKPLPVWWVRPFYVILFLVLPIVSFLFPYSRFCSYFLVIAGILAIAGICFVIGSHIVQSIRASSNWNLLEPKLIEMATQLKNN